MSQPNRRGRPRLDPTAPRPSEPINVTLSPRDYDTAAKIAGERRQSIQDLIRHSLRRELHARAKFRT